MNSELRVRNREIRVRTKGAPPSGTDIKAPSGEIAPRLSDFRRIIGRETPGDRKEFVRVFAGETLWDADEGEVFVGFFKLPAGRFEVSYISVECPQGALLPNVRKPGSKIECESLKRSGP